MTHAPGTARAIAASLRTYHRDTARAEAMRALLSEFVPQGGLAFDIGAHLGDRTTCFRRLGARAVTVEPQPALHRALRLIHGRDPGVTLVQAAVGPAPGRLTLHLNTANPTVATASDAFIAAAAHAPGWEDQRWDATVEVPVTTLDALAARHGAPDFIKIDIEGFEDAALRGLTAPPPALSFEFTTIQRDVAHNALTRLAALGFTRFNASLGESHALTHDTWLPAPGIATWLDALPHSANSGDIYARG